MEKRVIDFTQKVLFLAPLAGLSDAAFRTLAKLFGADVTVSEMVSANALVFENRAKKGGAKSLLLTQKSPFESPYLVQISGENVAHIQEAVEILNEIDGVDGIDLNCGCPVPKVVKQGAGSALLQTPKTLCEIIETIKKHSKKRYTSLKIRLGFNEKNLASLIEDIQNAGADFVAIHGRTRAQGYSGVADYEAIAAVKARAKIPVIANGDITQHNALEVLQVTNADGLMIGRGAVGRAWGFALIKQMLAGEVSNSVLTSCEAQNCEFGAQIQGGFEQNLSPLSSKNLQKPNLNLAQDEFERVLQQVCEIFTQNPPQASVLRLDAPVNSRQIGLVALAHLRMMQRLYGERSVGLFRKHLHEYSRAFVGASEFRQSVNRQSDFEKTCELIKTFFQI